MQATPTTAEWVFVTPARQVIPGRTVFVTSRCSNRQFRAVPTKRNVEAIWYCLGAAMTKYPGVQVHAFLWMSNHFHFVATPQDDSLPEFMQYLNSLTSRALNALRRTSGPNFEPHYNIVVATDPHKALEHCAYTLANPCAADLVTKAENWRGVTSFGMKIGRARTVERPRRGLWKAPKAPATRRYTGASRREASRGRTRYLGRRTTPASARVCLTRLPGFDGVSERDLEAKLLGLVREAEDKAEAKRVGAKRRVLGMRRVRAQRWNDYPRKPEDMFGPVPKASGTSHWRRREAEQLDRVFQTRYRTAFSALRDGIRNVVFPFGTWLMRRRFNVSCAVPSG